MKLKRNVIKPHVVVMDEERRAERIAHARQAERNELLWIAQWFVEKHERRDARRVLIFAEDLLAWLDQSANDLDRSARMSALKKVESASRSSKHEAVPAAELIDRASVYYRFIAA